MKLPIETKKQIEDLRKEGVAVQKIAAFLNLTYSAIYEHLNRRGLLSNRYVTKNKWGVFPYRQYTESLLCRCRKLTHLSQKKFDKFIKTEQGEFLLLKESQFFTPSIYMNNQEKLKRRRR